MPPETLTRSNKRFIMFLPNTAHPVSLNMSWTKHFPPEASAGAEPEYFFVRKVEAETEDGRELVKWIRDKHFDAFA
jgi:hypothetical protein